MKKFNLHCRIANYLQQEDKDLYDVMDNLCLLGSLNPRGQTSGITLLIPEEKSYRDQIFTAARSAELTDVNFASDCINALILRDCFKSAADFGAKKDDIPNSLHPPQSLKIESVGAAEVVFVGGARIVIDPGFRSSSHKDNLAVWKIKKGKIPITTDSPSPLKYSKGKTAPKKGGYEVQNIKTEGLRFKIAVAVENSFAMEQIARRNDPSAGGSDSFYRAIWSLLRYAQTAEPERLNSFYAPIQSAERLDFYILLEPHKSGGEYILSDATISGWWEEYRRDGNKSAGAGPLNLGWKPPAGLEAEIMKARINLLEESSARPRGIAESIEKLYQGIASTNRLGGCQDIYPAELFAKMSSEPNWKMVLDEIRYISHEVFLSLCGGSVFDNGKYNELVNIIGDCLQTAGTPHLLNKAVLSNLIAPRDRVEEIKIFVSSTCFLHFPMNGADYAPEETSFSKPSSAEGLIYNIEGVSTRTHQRIFMSGEKKNKDLAELIEQINGSELSAGLKERIKAELRS